MEHSTAQDDNHIFPALALALVDQPRATLQELAKAAGISKATLYRFCRTREQLTERLIRHSTVVLSQVVEASELDRGPPLTALQRLIANNLEHCELTIFVMHHWWKGSVEDTAVEADWQDALDAFFLRGQQQGIFRIDITASALTEIWSSVLIGLVDAERRGRVARRGLAALIESTLLQGVMAD